MKKNNLCFVFLLSGLLNTNMAMATSEVETSFMPTDSRAGAEVLVFNNAVPETEIASVLPIFSVYYGEKTVDALVGTLLPGVNRDKTKELMLRMNEILHAEELYHLGQVFIQTDIHKLSRVRTPDVEGKSVIRLLGDHLKTSRFMTKPKREDLISLMGISGEPQLFSPFTIAVSYGLNEQSRAAPRTPYLATISDTDIDVSLTHKRYLEAVSKEKSVVAEAIFRAQVLAYAASKENMERLWAESVAVKMSSELGLSL